MSTKISLLLTLCIIGGAVAWTFFAPKPSLAPTKSSENPITIREDGTQEIAITVKSGYHPRTVTAQAGIPTEITFTTNNNFDCSNDILIPALENKTQLAPTDTKTVALGTRSAGEKIEGGCSMGGMYNFEIVFE